MKCFVNFSIEWRQIIEAGHPVTDFIGCSVTDVNKSFNLLFLERKGKKASKVLSSTEHPVQTVKHLVDNYNLLKFKF